MRVAFSGTGFVGHLVPMFPLMRAFAAAGHEVAVITSADLTEFVHRQADASIVVLPAGPAAGVTMSRMAERLGVSPASRPVPPVIAEFFAGQQVDAGYARARREAARWRPDVVISEAMDFLGPLIAGGLGVPFYRHSFGPTRPRELTEALQKVAAGRAAAIGVPLAETVALIDIFPAFLQPGAEDDATRRIPLRPEIHHTPGATQSERGVGGASDALRSRALVTLGTVFTDPTVRERAADSMDADRWDIVVTTGSDARDAVDDATRRSTPHRRYVSFTPLDQLLPGVDVVVTAGGAGTVLSCLIAGIPMVILPLGADHGINAARAAAGGTALVVHDASEIGEAADRIVSDIGYAQRARTLADRITAMPPAADVAADLERGLSAARSSSDLLNDEESAS